MVGQLWLEQPRFMTHHVEPFSPQLKRRGESDGLPQAVKRAGRQAPCCLSRTLVVRHEPRGEFKARPERFTDKGTGAKHRQDVQPRRLSWGGNGVFAEENATGAVQARA